MMAITAITEDRKKINNWYFNGFFSYFALYIYKQKGKGYRKTWVKIEDYIS